MSNLSKYANLIEVGRFDDENIDWDHPVVKLFSKIAALTSLRAPTIINLCEGVLRQGEFNCFLELKDAVLPSWRVHNLTELVTTEVAGPKWSICLHKHFGSHIADYVAWKEGRSWPDHAMSNGQAANPARAGLAALLRAVEKSSVCPVFSKDDVDGQNEAMKNGSGVGIVFKKGEKPCL